MASGTKSGGDPVETYEHISEHAELDRQRIAVALDQSVKVIGHVVMWANIALVAAIATQVTLRYLLNLNFPKLDEIQWHFYGLVTMIGMSYALVTDSHVRVDLLYMQTSRRGQRIIEVLGILLLLAPLIYLMVDQGYDYFAESLRVNERSGSPTGLPMRWAFKAIIPVSFVLLGVAALARLIHDLHGLWTGPASERTGTSLRPILLTLLGFALATAALSLLVETTEEKLVIAMFMTFIGVLFSGFPVAWTLAGIGVAFCGLAYAFDNDLMTWTGLDSTLTGLDYLTLGTVVNRVYSTMSNGVLVALPMFIFMGLMLDQSGVAERLMTSMQRLFGKTRGGLAITVTLIGIILAASTGIIGASVVLLGVLSLPSMMKQNYSKPLATGVIAASGTLGILIPPSIMLVVMAELLSRSVGVLFFAALMPGLLLAGLYGLYLVAAGALRPANAPRPAADPALKGRALAALLWRGLVPPVLLILLVLGSILAGWASPTEAAGVGAAGAIALALLLRRRAADAPRFGAVLGETVERTALTGGMLFGIFIGATAFSLVFRALGGDDAVIGLIEAAGLGPWGLLAAVMALVFALGFFFDWIEITLIVLPVFAPIIEGLDFGTHIEHRDLPYWFAILMAVNLQTSFLTPPFGFALFYMKGSAPPEVKIQDIYRGIVPFVMLQLIGLALVMAFPGIAMWLPNHFLN